MKIRIIKENQMVIDKAIIDNYEKDMQNKLLEIQKLQDINKLAENKLKDLNKRINQLDKDMDKLKITCENTTKDNITLAAEVATLSMEKERLTKSNAGYKGNMTKMKNQLQVLKGGKDGKCK